MRRGHPPTHRGFRRRPIQRVAERHVLNPALPSCRAGAIPSGHRALPPHFPARPVHLKPGVDARVRRQERAEGTDEKDDVR
jgi:hypothetical protein